jgi:hypothetical protein
MSQRNIAEITLEWFGHSMWIVTYQEQFLDTKMSQDNKHKGKE